MNSINYSIINCLYLINNTIINNETELQENKLIYLNKHKNCTNIKSTVHIYLKTITIKIISNRI